MRICWPELIIGIIIVAFLLFAAELAILTVILEFHAPLWLAGTMFLAMVFFDLWAVLRTIDWLMAGPARRKGWRVF